MEDETLTNETPNAENEAPEASNPEQPQVDSGNAEIAKLTSERDHYLEMARRSRADFENYQKRVTRDLQNERRYAMQPLVVDLLPVLDNMDRALSATEDVPEAVKGLVQGIQMVKKQWVDAFTKHNIVPIDPTGEPFDPNIHEAVMQQPSPDKPAMTVLQTLQAGYKLHDRVIRPAQVIVSVGGPTETSDEPQADPESEDESTES